ncbi:MAG: Spo0E family sporulation regulatory protein-aspartic acid phosphatase [Syntrophomonadaceae bacterium]|nr:Spo0E family sporulation regulatory protein-aspartic acid phosphatase [Syntrophomonadaceae bacterium]
MRKQLNEMTKNAALEQQEVLRVSRMLDEEINNYYRLLARTQ